MLTRWSETSHSRTVCIQYELMLLTFEGADT